MLLKVVLLKSHGRHILSNKLNYRFWVGGRDSEYESHSYIIILADEIDFEIIIQPYHIYATMNASVTRMTLQKMMMMMNYNDNDTDS